MSWYRMVDVRIHGDEKYLNLTPDEPSGRALFKHLLICPENGPLPGVVRAGSAALAEALEWLPERLRERFGELFREGLAEADWKARLVFLPNGIKYNPPNNPNVVAGWARHWDALPEGPLKRKIWERYHAHFLEEVERRTREIESGERDKKQDPSALLTAFLKVIPKPIASGPETVTLTVPGTVTGTVDGSSAGARARLPEPEPESEPEKKEREGEGDRGRGEPGAPPPGPRGAGAASSSKRFTPEPLTGALDTPELQAEWAAFAQHRRELRKPLTPQATKHAAAELAEMGPARALRALRHTIAKGWQGIREPDPERNGANGRASPQPPLPMGATQETMEKFKELDKRLGGPW